MRTSTGVLIQRIHRVRRRPENRVTRITARFGGSAIADERILEPLARHGRAVKPILLARSHLAQSVVLVNPLRTVGIGHGHALVGVVVRIGEGGDRRDARAALNGRQSVQVVIRLGRRHSGHTVLPELMRYFNDW